MGDKKKKKKEVPTNGKAPVVNGKAPLANGKAHAPVSSHPGEIPTKRIGKDCDYEKELRRLQSRAGEAAGVDSPRASEGGGAV